jgi:hypothetical protein
MLGPDTHPAKKSMAIDENPILTTFRVDFIIPSVIRV